ncbi:hypothetical protein H6G97_31730 [Nostoc flagelliforme FACHB-838]|uniref:Uncharacterized protein n=1 Tax=Nostoc flagelliforme FACHB-838 TaxID=2692904 RepID=A0ABR8DWQ9_9NOSO|nr:hypothetical protein [Nostoc flagelliforme]MBD2533874.1 hypothetical protein [Nostoc flagelliforme FACHB-838]
MKITGIKRGQTIELLEQILSIPNEAEIIVKLIKDFKNIPNLQFENWLE